MKIEWPYKALWKSSQRRLRVATVEAAVYLEEIRRLREMVYDVIPEKSDEPLYRRITNQRRALRQMQANSEMYRRWWLDEFRAHNQLRIKNGAVVETTTHVVE